MKPGDIVLLLFLVVLSFLPVILFSLNQASDDHTHYTAVVSANGEVVHEFELMDDDVREVYEYVSEDGESNTIVREGTIVYMIDASCTDQLCVRQGEISEMRETIVCLPHALIVEVQSESPDIENDSEIDAIT